MHLIQLKVIMIMILILNLIIISITRTSSGFLCLTFFNHHQTIPFALFDINITHGRITFRGDSSFLGQLQFFDASCKS